MGLESLAGSFVDRVAGCFRGAAGVDWKKQCTSGQNSDKTCRHFMCGSLLRHDRLKDFLCRAQARNFLARGSKMLNVGVAIHAVITFSYLQ